MMPSSGNGKQPAGSVASSSHRSRKRLLVASHGADADASGHLCYTEWGKGVDIISEIRADEHGFGHPDIFTTKSAIFLSYRAESQTHVLPLTEDGEITNMTLTRSTPRRANRQFQYHLSTAMHPRCV